MPTSTFASNILPKLPCHAIYPTVRGPYRPHPATTELCLHVRCPKWLDGGGIARLAALLHCDVPKTRERSAQFNGAGAGSGVTRPTVMVYGRAKSVCTMVAPDGLCLSEVASRYFWGLSIVSAVRAREQRPWGYTEDRQVEAIVIFFFFRHDIVLSISGRSERYVFCIAELGSCDSVTLIFPACYFVLARYSLSLMLLCGHVRYHGFKLMRSVAEVMTVTIVWIRLQQSRRVAVR